MSSISLENGEFVDQLYNDYKNRSDSVSEEWQKFFSGVDFASDGKLGLNEKELNVFHLISAYRDYGHFEAQVNPLQTLTPPPGSGSSSTSASATAPSSALPSTFSSSFSSISAPSSYLALERYHLSEKDLDVSFQIARILGYEKATLREILKHLKNSYCGTLTIQCAETFPEIRNWFIKEFEIKKNQFKLTAEEKKNIFISLSRTECLEKFIHTRYVGTKRFSIEGGDSLLPMLESCVQKSSAFGFQEIVIGMTHRGRVNVLANFMDKGLNYIFADFNGTTETSVPIDDFEGDVKYHLGYEVIKKTTQSYCKIILAFNPSHLEAVNPVVLGMTRAAQRRLKDTQKRKKVIPILIHGDAAFAGQGLVAETFQMSQVKGYTVGGAIHLVIDNQIGFTTSPTNGRSSYYCSDIAKTISAPILHVNGDDPEACVQAMDIALRYRQQWGRDIVINLVCYRRYGHNEGDEPAYTQALMYEKIKNHSTVREIYGNQLIQEKVIDKKIFYDHYQNLINELQKIYEQTKSSPPKIEPFKFEGFWKGYRKARAEDFETTWDTRIDKEVLKKIALHLATLPDKFSLHPKLVKMIESRKNVAEEKELIDWGMGELLTYGSIIQEGNSVRLTGQDCVRGTFSHRHAGFFDVKTGESYFPLKTLKPEKEFCVYDSILSEYGVMGFEYGNAICDPTFLTIWEAQFGDFANGAQILIDQFLTSGESKWQQMCGLVLLLPHSFEGQGPEHSSARLERFLQLCAQYNIQVTNLTSPAQFFHAMRRQMKRPFRKPFINMSPKSLLRHPKALSTIEELSKGFFQEVIPDKNFVRGTELKRIETLLLCTGKIFYELDEAWNEEAEKCESVAIVRIEQLYPTPLKQIGYILKSYPQLKKVVWVQEEPKNMGAFQFMYFKLMEYFKNEILDFEIQYVGRSERASPATGSFYRHKEEQRTIIKTALGLKEK